MPGEVSPIANAAIALYPAFKRGALNLNDIHPSMYTLIVFAEAELATVRREKMEAASAKSRAAPGSKVLQSPFGRPKWRQNQLNKRR